MLVTQLIRYEMNRFMSEMSDNIRYSTYYVLNSCVQAGFGPNKS